MSPSDSPVKSKATAILVLGMHRSGTSATTRVLNLLGANLGDNLLDAQADNTKGFWEHADAVQIHDELLTALGRTWHDIREMPSDWLEHPASYAAIDKIVQLIRKDFQHNTLWAVKDPRMCRLVPLWLCALERLDIRATALIVVRDPREVACSLNVRDGWSYAHSYHMWAQHFLESVRLTEDVPRAIVSYDDLMSDWSSTVTRVGRCLKINWTRTAEDAGQDIESFINPSDRHHHTAVIDSDVATNEVPPRALMELYAVSVDIAAGHADWSELVSINARYLDAASIYNQSVDELVQQRSETLNVALERMDHINGLLVIRDELTKQRDDCASVAFDRLGQIERMGLTIAELEARHGEISRQYQQLMSLYEIMVVRQSELETQAVELLSSVSTLQCLSQDYERRLLRARSLMSSRKWLLRKVLRQTFRSPNLPDDEL